MINFGTETIATVLLPTQLLVELQNASSCEDEWSLVADVFQGTTCDSLSSDYSCQELILALIDVFEFGGTLEHDFDWKYFDVLTPEWIELNNASWDSALYVFFEENRSDFRSLSFKRLECSNFRAHGAGGMVDSPTNLDDC